MSSRSGTSLDAVSYAGIGVAAVGLGHFVVPQAFAPITAPVFPDDTKTWTYRNGATETAIGAALISPRTRKIGWAGLAAYVGFLGYRAVQSRR
ncbi:hypothetical protein [Gordonia soli]|uniref:Uncharacterized protein n=1 Tax=Gordonia soli NBRC 108243 TaxID=1223545 RepID=M0QIM7_9ACTN|nr:hypothetical protein [Gordonia soli]GAC68470.1 hypothetical protein GS4_15_01200 [Gordonia soli NBRC 108243]